MSATPDAYEHQDSATRYGERCPIGWIAAVADQLAEESGLARTADLEDLVIIAYLGLLDSRDPEDLASTRLLARSRRALITWVWEQGTVNEARPPSLESHAH